MQKTNIEWVKNPDGTQGYSWNPIKGKCPAECKLPDGRIYCYGHGLYDRFDWLSEGTVPESLISGVIDEGELGAPKKRKKPTGIFACSTYDLFFHKHHSWRDGIFETIEACPHHRFYILTKFPQNIDRELPPNVWLGVSVTGDKDAWRLRYLEKTEACLKFVSIEPFLNYISDNTILSIAHSLNWMIIGRLTGHGREYDPERRDIERLFEVKEYAKYNQKKIPVFLKNNLSGIWPDELIQEMPG